MWQDVVPVIICFLHYAVSLRCYSDHEGPNTRYGVEHCDGAAVCSQSRIVFREGGVVKVARGNHCKEPTRIDKRSNEGWPWCSEEWGGSDEGGMETLTCYCKNNLCNDKEFQSEEFLIWIAATKERLKAGNAHIMDIFFNLATGIVIMFFITVIWRNLPQKVKGKIIFFSGKTVANDDLIEEDQEEKEDLEEKKEE